MLGLRLADMYTEVTLCDSVFTLCDTDIKCMGTLSQNQEVWGRFQGDLYSFYILNPLSLEGILFCFGKVISNYQIS